MTAEGPRSRDPETAHYRCVGVGVGPANLSLASLLHGKPGVSNLFLDREDRFGWHDGQQIPGASLQVSLLKDLVTLSDPTNRFSFLSYLHERGRIYHFINAQFDAVPRQEFRNYLQWASEANDNVCFGEEVRHIDFDGAAFVIHTSRRTVTSDNVVVGVGTKPWVPEPARGKLGGSQFHVSDFLRRDRSFAGKRVAVVGGGQSGAEVFLDLLSRPADQLPRRVTWVSRRHNYFPIDDTPFTNEYYVPSYSDYFFDLDRPARVALNAQNVLTSDGISESTLREIYQRCYALRFVDGAEDLFALLPNRVVTGVAADRVGWDLTVEGNDDPGQVEHVEADYVVWATGYRSAPTEFLSPLAHRLERAGDEYTVDKDFAIRWDGPRDRSIFLQNGVREQRGLADPNLSLVAWRSQRIMDRLLGVRSNEQLEPFIDWAGKHTTAELHRA
ncbi:lysine N(6)-hydroxylase/L-ornithine N(5)-oxygenase family protein [Amycolatopsis magusensis]|uniref:L-lysine N6-monooxygenase MbtG n=1 Tax=Amycolatopsis magusensis TaxID=882444 RepID=A0ABS4PY27_9PSEU|nr:SidA/IucD/PvdA family monooxygenase [Amycolatopsis magusensis]MBP2184337.1 lysine N6-hydroxylase [Amycolatopsis magusensis]MDI5978138.1 SidA/IucD/PvdA family monooxygenase [Amycolatopsis magusensis]